MNSKVPVKIALYNIATGPHANPVTSLFRIKVSLQVQNAKYNLSIKVTKNFDQDDYCDQQLLLGVKTTKRPWYWSQYNAVILKWSHVHVQ